MAVVSMILNALMQRPRSIADHEALMTQRDTAAQQNALLQMQMQRQMQAAQRETARNNALKQHGMTPESVNALMQAGDIEGAQSVEQMLAQRAQEQRMRGFFDSLDSSKGPALPFDPVRALAMTRNPALVQQVSATLTKDQPKPMAVNPGQRLVLPQQDGSMKEVYSAPDKPEAAPEVVRLMNYRDSLPPGDPRRAVIEASLRKSTTHAPATNVNVNTAPKAFWSDVGKQTSDAFAKEREAAQSAAGIIQSVAQIRQAVSGGAYQGTGAELKLGAAKALGALGMPYDEKTVANTEVFNATANKFVLDSIKQLGANPSNADREFIEKTVPRLQTDPAALPSLLNFMETKARNQVRSYNNKARQVQGRPEAAGMPFSLEVPEPEGAAPAPIPAGGGWSIKPKGQ